MIQQCLGVEACTTPNMFGAALFFFAPSFDPPLLPFLLTQGFTTIYSPAWPGTHNPLAYRGRITDMGHHAQF